MTKYVSARSRNRAITPAAGSATAMSPNPRRVGVYFSPPATGRYSVAFGEAAVLDSGITIAADSNGYYATKDMIGDDITAETHVIGSAAITAGWLEVYTE